MRRWLRRVCVAVALAGVFVLPSVAGATEVTVTSSEWTWTGPSFIHSGSPPYNINGLYDYAGNMVAVTAQGSHAADVARWFYLEATGQASPIWMMNVSTSGISAPGGSYGNSAPCYWMSVQSGVAPNGTNSVITWGGRDFSNYRFSVVGDTTWPTASEHKGPVHFYVYQQAADDLYAWVVSKYNADFSGYWSEPADDFCAAPQNVRVESVTSNSVALAWDSVEDSHTVVGYRVFADSALVATPTVNLAVISGLTDATGYTFGVAAVDGRGNVSAVSTVDTVTVNPLAEEVDASLPGWIEWIVENEAVASVKEWMLQMQRRLLAGVDSLLWFLNIWGE